MDKVLNNKRFKFISIVLLCYAVIGIVIFTQLAFSSVLQGALAALLFVFIPLLGALGAWFKKIIPLSLCALFFVVQSVRYISPENLLPNIAPISISFAAGSFTNGSGFLIDLFAIAIAAYLLFLIWGLVVSNRLSGGKSVE